MKNVLKWVSVLLLSIMIVGIFISGNHRKDAPTPYQTDETMATTKANDPEEKEHRIGDIVKVNNLAYRVNQVESAKQIGSGVISEKADGYFLMVNLTVTNQGKEPQTIDSSMFTLIEDDGTRYAANGAVAMFIKGNNNFFLEKLNPKLSKTGYVVFDVPTVKVEYSLRVTGGLQSNESAVIRLEK